LEIFGDLDIENIRRFGYWKYFKIWISGIFGYSSLGFWRSAIGDLDIRDWILEIWKYLEIG